MVLGGKARFSLFLLVLFLGVSASYGQTGTGVCDLGPQRARALSEIEALTSRIRSHYEPSGDLEILAAIADGIAIPVINGFIVAGVSRTLSGRMAALGAADSQGTAYSLYSAVVLALSWRIMRFFGIGEPLRSISTCVMLWSRSPLGRPRAGQAGAERDLWPQVPAHRQRCYWWSWIGRAESRGRRCPYADGYRWFRGGVE